MRKVLLQRGVFITGAFIAACFMMTACAKKSKLPDLSSLGEIDVVVREGGSSSISPIMQKLIDGYRKYNENVQIALTTSDSSSGLNAAIRGECDWAISSRTLKDYEKELLETKVIGSDAIALLVNKDNPVENLTMKQIRGIYDKDFEKWEDIK